MNSGQAALAAAWAAFPPAKGDLAADRATFAMS